MLFNNNKLYSDKCSWVIMYFSFLYSSLLIHTQDCPLACESLSPGVTITACFYSLMGNLGSLSFLCLWLPFLSSTLNLGILVPPEFLTIRREIMRKLVGKEKWEIPRWVLPQLNVSPASHILNLPIKLSLLRIPQPSLLMQIFQRIAKINFFLHKAELKSLMFN